jgi:hypothetical protein
MLAEEWWSADVETDHVTSVLAAGEWVRPATPRSAATGDDFRPPVFWALLGGLPLLGAVAHGVALRRSAPARLFLPSTLA